MDVLLFGITRELTGRETLHIPADIAIKDVSGLRLWLSANYPRLSGMSSLAIAVNNEYADDDRVLDDSSEIALIPPVSGG